MKEVENWLDKFKSLMDQRFSQLDQLLKKQKNKKV
jgi:hypothetical protein